MRLVAGIMNRHPRETAILASLLLELCDTKIAIH